MDLLDDFPGSSQRGAQSLSRALCLLRIVSDMNQEGARLTEIVAASGLAKPTVHRMLSEMLVTGLLMRAERRYRLGQFAYELGLTASQHFRLREFCLPSVRELAETVGGTVYLATRSGAESFCLEMQSCACRPWARNYGRGARVPLGVGASSLALLSFLPGDERKAMVARYENRVPDRAGARASSIGRKVNETRASGFAATDGDVVPGVSALGVPVFDRVGYPVLAISVAESSNRMSRGHRQKVLDALYAQAERLSESLRGPPDW